jgi:phosphopantetheine adenylyltransferase
LYALKSELSNQKEQANEKNAQINAYSERCKSLEQLLKQKEEQMTQASQELLVVRGR